MRIPNVQIAIFIFNQHSVVGDAQGVVAESVADSCSVATHMVEAGTAAPIAAVVFDASDEVDVAQDAHCSKCNLHFQSASCCLYIRHCFPV